MEEIKQETVEQKQTSLEEMVEQSEKQAVEATKKVDSKNLSNEREKPAESQIKAKKDQSTMKVEQLATKEDKELPKFVKQDAVIELLSQARARVARVASTNISMSCREVLAMVNGMIDNVNKM